jgi:hypothetical protein
MSVGLASLAFAYLVGAVMLAIGGRIFKKSGAMFLLRGN